ncbi:MAG: DedA family protein [Nitrospirota bacterium]
MHGLSGVVERSPYAGLFILLILGGMGFPFPEDATLILCGFLIAQKVIQPVPAFFVIYSGLLLADFFLFFIGKSYGRSIVAHKRFHKIISPEKLSMLEDKFNKKGAFIILFGRHFVGLRAQIFIVAGIMRMSSLKFIMADAVSSLFTIALMVGAGYAGGHSLEVVKKDVTRIEHVGILLFAIFFTFYVLFRYFKSRKNSDTA